MERNNKMFSEQVKYGNVSKADHIIIVIREFSGVWSYLSCITHKLMAKDEDTDTIYNILTCIPLCLITKQMEIYAPPTQLVLFKNRVQVFYSRLHVSVIADSYEVSHWIILIHITSIMIYFFIKARIITVISISSLLYIELCMVHGWEEINAYGSSVGEPEGKRVLANPRSRSKDNTKTDLEETGQGEKGWTGIIWLRTQTSGGLFSTRQWPFVVHTMRGISSLAEEL
jgi:hypothetical protein